MHIRFYQRLFKRSAHIIHLWIGKTATSRLVNVTIFIRRDKSIQPIEKLHWFNAFVRNSVVIITKTQLSIISSGTWKKPNVAIFLRRTLCVRLQRITYKTAVVPGLFIWRLRKHQQILLALLAFPIVRLPPASSEKDVKRDFFPPISLFFVFGFYVHPSLDNDGSLVVYYYLGTMIIFCIVS